MPAGFKATKKIWTRAEVARGENLRPEELLRGLQAARRREQRRTLPGPGGSPPPVDPRNLPIPTVSGSLGGILSGIGDAIFGGGGGGGGGGLPGGPFLPPAPVAPPAGGGGGLGSLCNLLPIGTARQLCQAGAGAIGGGGGGGGGSQLAGCPDGTIKVGNRCVAPGDAFPGGDPFITGAGGNAVQGGFGLPAITPTVEQRTHRTCPDGMVLGKDNLCYPKAVLSRRSRFRKWRQPRRPLFTAGDMNAIRRAERLKKKAKGIAKDLGFSVRKRGRSR